MGPTGRSVGLPDLGFIAITYMYDGSLLGIARIPAFIDLDGIGLCGKRPYIFWKISLYV
jgi:hypothetical protein